MTISPEFRPRLVVMAKAPVAGQVKTRLGRDIGMVAATWWFRHQLRHTLRSLRDSRWELVLSVTPDTAVHGRWWPAGLPRMGQGRGDLGARMAFIFRALPPGPALIVGGDIPGISRVRIARAFAALGAADAVFGPATDGGYWLVGMKRVRPVPPEVFAGVRWSTRHALADSRATLKGWRLAEVDRLADVDRASDL